MFGEIGRRVALRPRGKGIFLQANTQQTITNATFNTLTWDTIIRDDLRTVDLTNHNTRITIPIEGWYLFTAMVSWTGNVTGFRYIDMLLNGGSVTPMYISAGCAGGDGGPVLNCGCGYYCKAGDYFELRVYQNSTISITTHNYPPYASFAAAQVGG